MKQRHLILLTIFALILAIPLILIMWPEKPLDLSKEEEPFRSMVLPLQRVEGETKENIVLVHVFDATGRRFNFLFYRDDSDPWTAYPNRMNMITGMAVRSPRASAVISRLIKESKNRDEGSINAMESLSRRPANPGTRIFWKVKNFLHSPQPQRVD
jgi:hypothetical protein